MQVILSFFTDDFPQRYTHGRYAVSHLGSYIDRTMNLCDLTCFPSFLCCIGPVFEFLHFFAKIV